MSLPPPPERNGVQQQHRRRHESFAEFFERWLTQQERDLQDLLQAAAAAREASSREEEEEEEVEGEDEARLGPLLSRVVSHYESYYRDKSASARRDVLPMFSPDWTSSTENLFLWVGGWRPSMAFHLLYSKSGLQLESSVSGLLRGLHCGGGGDLSGLSHHQLRSIDQLQGRTILLEKEISEQEAKVQETLADAQMVELAARAARPAAADEAEAVEREMRGKREGMEKVLERADRLRLDTLKALVGLLRPMQAAHFMIAAAELHLTVHDFGKRKDAAAAAEADSPSLA
ncbi:putative transcription factor TGA6 [Iris pallida]|uniref:Transcription factor TGA6 n=1 Tax=Iris pallida TaxID=29817 RepID=A0AAX6E4G9_IRIPA|nr:putative transcription factor TGA6 [Iris pallida]KAJ6822865.1 putative transcription factor TGA6 [Iris pallida]